MRVLFPAWGRSPAGPDPWESGLKQLNVVCKPLDWGSCSLLGGRQHVRPPPTPQHGGLSNPGCAVGLSTPRASLGPLWGSSALSPHFSS